MISRRSDDEVIAGVDVERVPDLSPSSRPTTATATATWPPEWRTTVHRTIPVSRLIISLVLLVLLVPLAASCGSSSGAVATTSPTTIAATTSPSTVAPSTTVAPTTELSTTTTPGPKAKNTFTGIALHADTLYEAAVNKVGGIVQYVPVADGVMPTVLSGFLALDPATATIPPHSLLTIIDLDTAKVFTSPYPSLGGTSVQLETQTEPMVPDVLAHIAALPGVKASTAADVTVDGHTAHSMTYTVGKPTTGTCDAATGAGCLATIFVPAGASIVYLPGDAGTLYVVELGGHQVLVDVPNKPDSRAQFQTLHFITG
jgi:hypothetical protein